MDIYVVNVSGMMHICMHGPNAYIYGNMYVDLH